MPGMVRDSCELLKVDGSNYDDWEFRITRLIQTTTGYVGYLDQGNASVADPHGDLIIQTMIEHSVETKIAKNLTQCDSAISAMATIKSLFFIPSKHLNLWKEIFQNKHDTKKGDIDEYIHNINIKFAELDQARFPWTRDSILGIIFQLGLPLNKVVSATLDACLRAQPIKSISAKEVEQAL